MRTLISRRQRSRLRRTLADRPLGAVVLARRAGRPELVPAVGADLLVEGFPRSANTYVVQALRLANPGLHLASHLHGVGAVALAARRGVPTLLLLRTPEGAVPSLCIREGFAPEDALDWYETYHRRVLRYRPHYEIGPFEEVTSSLDLTAARLNKRFGTHFDVPARTAEVEEELRRRVYESERQFAGEVHADRVSWPSTERSERSRQLARQLHTGCLAARLRSCEQVYARVMA